ncbi:MAG: hypothetical protein RL329_2261 [Bacteroidota bacterium]
MALAALHQTLSERKRPEDVAEMVLEILGSALSAGEQAILEKAAQHALKRTIAQYSSMAQTFAKPIGLEHQVKKAMEVFKIKDKPGFQYDNAAQIEAFLREINPIIHKTAFQHDYKTDRLNRAARLEKGMDLAKRQYNKLFRKLRHVEQKLQTFLVEQRKSVFQQVGKHGFAHDISFADFSTDVNAACFIAYYTAKCNLRSEFTIEKQQKPFDEIAEMLFNRVLKPTQIGFFTGRKKTNWWSIAQVYPNVLVLNQLTPAQKGRLLGKWTALLQELAFFLKKLWDENQFRKATMVVKRGDDSTTWNHTAAAWNKARSNWLNLLHAMGMEYVLDELCFGKVMRLMAADLVYWHQQVGNALDPNTMVWNELPLPWEVFQGEMFCNKAMVIQACVKAGLNLEKSGWIAPAEQTVAAFKPTPELVHGVSVHNPFLAAILKKHKFFSGKGVQSA